MRARAVSVAFSDPSSELPYTPSPSRRSRAGPLAAALAPPAYGEPVAAEPFDGLLIPGRPPEGDIARLASSTLACGRELGDIARIAAPLAGGCCTCEGT